MLHLRVRIRCQLSLISLYVLQSHGTKSHCVFTHPIYAFSSKICSISSHVPRAHEVKKLAFSTFFLVLKESSPVFLHAMCPGHMAANFNLFDLFFLLYNYSISSYVPRAHEKINKQKRLHVPWAHEAGKIDITVI